MRALLTLSESALSHFSRTKSPGFSTYVKNGGGVGVGYSNFRPPASNSQNAVLKPPAYNLQKRGTPCLTSPAMNAIINASN